MAGFRQNLVPMIVSIATCVLTIFIGYYVQRADFTALLGGFAAFFALYAVSLFSGSTDQPKYKWYIALGIGLRVLLLWSIPNLSDDVFRFLWDGRLLAHGIHPFAYTPEAVLQRLPALPGLSLDLYGKLNSPQYYSVYPPVCQALFWVAAKLSPWSIGGGVFVLKLFLLGCEIGTIGLLYKHISIRNAALYALNPLVIFEISGNCHFEGAMIFFMLAGILALRQKKVLGSACYFALATASKLLPILLVPVIWRYLGWKRGTLFTLYFGLICVALFLPLLDVKILLNMASSLDLYFQQFQFNASVYYLVRAVGFWKYGWDIGEFLGPGLALATIAGVLCISYFTRLENTRIVSRLDLSDALLAAVMLYLTFATTVHPWYITVPFALSLLTGWSTPILWTSLAILSYSHYLGGVYLEKYGFVALEYSALWIFGLIEIKKRLKAQGA
jgi:alpha-1,6-mannosyltransferase